MIGSTYTSPIFLEKASIEYSTSPNYLLAVPSSRFPFLDRHPPTFLEFSPSCV